MEALNGPAAVLFDMDGTLLDSEKIWDITLEETARWLGGTVSAAARRAMVGGSLATSVARLHADVGVAGDALATGQYLLARTGERFAGALPWRPGARELLAEVRAAGLPTALVTSTERALVELALGTLGAHHFDTIICGDEVRRPKPDPEPYLTAIQQLDVDPSRCVVIEDSPTGVAAAEAAGCVVVAVPSEVPVPAGPHRSILATLDGLTVRDLIALMQIRQPRAS